MSYGFSHINFSLLVNARCKIDVWKFVRHPFCAHYGVVVRSPLLSVVSFWYPPHLFHFYPLDFVIIIRQWGFIQWLRNHQCLFLSLLYLRPPFIISHSRLLPPSSCYFLRPDKTPRKTRVLRTMQPFTNHFLFFSAVRIRLLASTTERHDWRTRSVGPYVAPTISSLNRSSRGKNK